jgi:WD40 repeat protein
VAFSPDGRTLATGGYDYRDNAGAVRLWNLAGPTRPHTLLATLEPRSGGPVASVAFSPDGHTLAADGGDNTVRLWDTAAPAHPRTLTTLKGHTSEVPSVAFSPNGRTLATGGYEGVRLWAVD